MGLLTNSDAGGVFQNLSMYCGMAFDKKQDVKTLCSYGSDDSLCVCLEQTKHCKVEQEGW